jgi:hypothetical protein
MSFFDFKNSNTGKLVGKLGLKLNSRESAEGSVPADVWVNSIIKIAVIFIIGIVILNAVVANTGVNNSSMPFYDLMQSVQSNITSGYTLASLMVLVCGAAAVMHFLGFI